VDAIVTFTEADADAVRALAPAAPVTALPFQLTPSPEPLDPLGGSPPTVLFYGSFEHPPNVEAALRLATRIHPRVRERVPGARLALIGAAPPPQLVALASETVEVPGFVDDLRAAVARAAVLAAPLRLGGGMRVKVVEALAFGKALVASPLAIEGLAVSSGRELLVAETDDETADALGRVLSDPALRLRLAAAARAWAEREAARDWIRAVEALYGPEAERPIPLE
jgi:glycosyltransferase involved in cell wall biosynthesis